jgi:hypothetical protein
VSSPLKRGGHRFSAKTISGSVPAEAHTGLFYVPFLSFLLVHNIGKCIGTTGGLQGELGGEDSERNSSNGRQEREIFNREGMDFEKRIILL